MTWQQQVLSKFLYISGRFTPTPKRPPFTYTFRFVYVGWGHRRNHPCQVSSQSVQQLRLTRGWNSPFPIGLENLSIYPSKKSRLGRRKCRDITTAPKNDSYNSVTHWRATLWSSYCTGVNRQQMMWQQQVLSKFLYISGCSVAGITHVSRVTRKRWRGTCVHQDRG